jgi:transcriptional regulatory protein RtcR
MWVGFLYVSIGIRSIGMDIAESSVLNRADKNGSSSSAHNRPQVVFGFFGTVKDAGMDESRWNTWRPTVSLFAADQPGLTRLELLITDAQHLPLAERVAQDIQQIRSQASVGVHNLAIKDPWNFVQVYSALHEFARAYAFDDHTDYFVHLTTGTHVAKICLFLLLEARYFPARIVESFADSATSPHQWRGRLEVIDLNVAAYDQLAQRFRIERLEGQGLLKDGIETRNHAFNLLIGRIERVALASTAPILLSGPTGAGKSQLARRIFDLRKRRHLVAGAFIEVNCATLRGDNAMSALFGHRKGAFTGALADRSGLLREADKGILFLDEVAELGLEEQAMLLRAIEDRRFRPMGTEKEVQSDFQLICGTNQDLTARSATGRFRADLLARINLWDFVLPGLKDRREDIEPNLLFETERASQQLGARVSWSAPAWNRFMEFAMEHAWPGNFRELGSAVARMATLADGYRITVIDVEVELETLGRGSRLDPIGRVNRGRTLNLVHRVLTDATVDAADLFDLNALEGMLEIVRDAHSMADAGRRLFAASRLQKTNCNDSDRVRKYLAGWGLDYRGCKDALRESA